MKKEINAESSPQKLLLRQCVSAIVQGIDVIEKLDDERFSVRPADSVSSVGAHFRHNLDFLVNFLRGVCEGRIDYHQRERELRVETDRRYAAQRLQAAAAEIALLSPEELSRKILVRSETNADLWCESSVMRELEFLLSHTIHHYALIETKLAIAGIPVPKDFGVASSTLEFWKGQTA